MTANLMTEMKVELSKELMGYLPENEGKARVLHLGCGEGQITTLLQQHYPNIIGADFSAQSIRKASKNYPNISFVVADLFHPSWDNTFDIIFYFEPFQRIWMQQQLYNMISRSLKPSGILIAQTGSSENLKEIEHALQSTMSCYGYTFQSPFCNLPADAYKNILLNSGFGNQQIEPIEVPITLPGGHDALLSYIQQIFNKEFATIPMQIQNEIFAHIENVFLSNLWDGQSWNIHLHHLRIIASKFNDYIL